MKNTSFAWMASAVLALSGLAALPACDVVDNPTRAIVTSSLTPVEQARLDSAEATQTALPLTQNVLIEDYTGQYCGNCPRAAHMADSMRQKYPGRVVVTEVHVTDYFAAPRLPHFPIDFRVPDISLPLPNTAASTAITQAFDLENRGLPQGAVNRARFTAANNDPVATFSLWPAVVAEQLALAPTVELRATPLYNRTTRFLRLKTATKYLTDMAGRNMRLGITMVEDSLIGAQKDYTLNRTANPEQTTEHYEHHNVMRAALAGTFGTLQVTGPTSGQQFSDYLGYKLPADWNDRHCSVIVYIADADTRQIVQVTQVKLP
ncbi:Omp28-related outer membrane protein [Hymenobacter negativus]|uniref:Omp28-related outer membrane protein n=1 Tax=Hymenobacter negativus TaxID=2795026 RepID=A0ABS3QEH8_9BACT|nr:Omp28-related outer membrane protein [Hymenobacter negativus]MBO2009219.1 Omp28-related outer membrane protein [Hymenobacter negativus]